MKGVLAYFAAVLDVLYYHYHLFYQKILKEDEPNIWAVLTFSFSLAIPPNMVIDFIVATKMCINLSKWPQLALLGVVILINYYFYIHKGRAGGVIRAKPAFFSNRAFSIVVTVVFAVGTTWWLFISAFYVRDILEKCGYYD